MATKLGTAVLQINVNIGTPYVKDDYVALGYVEGGIVTGNIARLLINVNIGTRYVAKDYVAVDYVQEGIVASRTAAGPGEATLVITSTLSATGSIAKDADPYNTFILSKETRLNTVMAETRLFPVLQETRSFKIKRPAFVGATRKDTINV
jgi:hypothetical protein